MNLPHSLQQVHHLGAHAGLGRARAGLRSLEAQLDLCEHSNEQLVHVVVDAGGRLDVLAAVLDGQGFAAWKLEKF